MRYSRLLTAAGLALLAGTAGIAQAADAPTVAVLQGLDKTTARVTKFDAPVGQRVTFGTLTITVRDCRKRPPEEEPENAAFLDIEEAHPGKAETQRLFSGWMFSSSPAVSALEDPVYDVWVLDCETKSATAPAPSTAPAPDAAPTPDPASSGRKAPAKRPG